MDVSGKLYKKRRKEIVIRVVHIQITLLLTVKSFLVSFKLTEIKYKISRSVCF